MDKIKKIKINITLYAGGSTLIILALIYFIILPQQRKIEETQRGIDNQLITLEGTYYQGQHLKTIADNLEIAESKLKDLEKIYLQKSEAYILVNLIEDIAKKNNIIQRINLTPDSASPTAGYNKSSLEITLTGGYKDTINSLAEIETLDYYINIESMEITNTTTSIIAGDTTQKNITIKIIANIHLTND